MKQCTACGASCWEVHKHCPSCGADLSAVRAQGRESLLGATVGGKFKLEELLGEGAMGAVYRAEQTNLGRTVAVKIMNPILAADGEMVRRFYDEARAVSRLNHPNIVSILDFGQTDSGVLYIVMEYLPGRTLAQLISDEAPLPTARAAGILGQVLDALAEAHAARVIHRDLKTENIFIEALRAGRDFVKVLDFGIAKLKREEPFQTFRGPCGTPEYMPPEQVRGDDDIDGRADLYALGIVLYEMLTGISPFAGGTSIEIMQKQIDRLPIPPRQARPDLPIAPAIEGVILKALEKDRSARYPSAAAMKGALGAALHEETLSQRRTPLPGGRATRTRVMTPALGVEGARGEFPLPILHRPEWAQLAALAAPAAGGRGLALFGPDGVGKTSLLEYALRSAQAQGRTCFRTAPDPTGVGRPWFPVRQLARELLGLSGKPTLAMLEAALDRVGLRAADLTGLAELFGLVGDFSGLEYAARRRECRASLLRLVWNAAKQRPLLLAFDDIDAYDAPSRSLVERLLEDPGQGSLTVLATRKHREANAGPTEFLEVEVARLAPSEMRELARRALGGMEDGLREQIQEASRGVPLHVEQLLRYVAEGGGDPPTTLADTIGQRVARLPQDARMALQTVALAGGDVSHALVAALGVEPASPAIALLEERGLVAASPERVRILHPMFVEVAYEGMPDQVRRSLHERLWSVLEDKNASPLVMARHAYQTRERRAVPLLERAGERAQREFDDRSAATYYRHAVELQRWAMMEGVLEAEEAYVRLSVKLGEALYWTGDMVGAAGVLAEALRYVEGHPAREARVRLALARLASAREQLEQAERELRGGLRAGFGAGDPTLLAELYLESGNVWIKRGSLDAAVAELTEGVMLCTGGEGLHATAGPEVLWRLVGRHAEAVRQSGDVEGAIEIAGHALRHAIRVGSVIGEARLSTLLGELCEQAEQPDKAALHRQRGLELIRRLGDRKSTAELLLAEVKTQLKSGQVQRTTLSQVQEASELAAEVGWQEGVAESAAVLRQAAGSGPASVPPA